MQGFAENRFNKALLALVAGGTLILYRYDWKRGNVPTHTSAIAENGMATATDAQSPAAGSKHIPFKAGRTAANRVRTSVSGYATEQGVQTEDRHAENGGGTDTPPAGAVESTGMSEATRPSVNHPDTMPPHPVPERRSGGDRSDKSGGTRKSLDQSARLMAQAIYKDKPLNFSFEVGLRYSFGQQ